MAFLIGISLALLIGVFGSLVGLDRDRAFYPTIMIVIALLYALFAAVGGSFHALLAESVAIVVFVTAAVLGFRISLWIVAGALAAHGLYDLVHGSVIENPGVPGWWPEFCMAYDVVAAAYLGWLLLRSKSGTAS